MRILHLAYEDPQQPGSGGGSIRTREINSRLAQRHDIVALVAGYPGAEERVEDGLRWVPVGPRTGKKLDRLAYFPMLWREVRRRSYDLLVEDFGAPFSAAFSPLLTRQPVVASVQWLFASQMRDKYHLPFDWVERTGLRYYSDFITVSEWLADEVRRRKQDVTIEAIPNGVDDLAFEAEPASPEHLLFVGRLDVEHKGGDLLMEAYRRIRDRLDDAPPLLILGDGPDRGAMLSHARRVGIDGSVKFLGRVEGREKYRLMASAYAVLMPSRFETFGIVAAEALAVGAPLVTFDVGPLREVTGDAGARLIRPFDVQAFADAAACLVVEPQLAPCDRLARRTWARRYQWDDIASRQEQHYLRAVQRGNT